MTRIPDFTKPEWHAQRDDDHMLNTVLKGKGSMPAMKAKLGPNEVRLLVALVRNFKDGRQVVPEDPAEPEESAKSEKPQEAKEPAESRAPSPRIVSPSTSESAVPRTDPGRGVFQRFCNACHGGDGRGTAMRASLPGIPDFTSADWQSRRSEAQLTNSILEGKGAAMPTFGGKLADAQLRDVVAYIRSFASEKGAPKPKSSSDFRRRFDELRRQFEQLDRDYSSASSR